MATWETVRSIGLALPEVEESTWFRTPSLKVRDKSFVRLKEDDVIVVMVDLDEKEAMLAAEPEVFFTTPHYDGYPAMLARLSAIADDELREVLIESWRRKAPKKLVRDFDEGLL
ncbi:MAG: MmcQ/YjbR family DNA-binding protein [Actinomycetota bacterium]|nr:MmcQ/YjbR family DNA-binding protein [Actinomycetota bacterium]